MTETQPRRARRRSWGKGCFLVGVGCLGVAGLGVIALAAALVWAAASVRELGSPRPEPVERVVRVDRSRSVETAPRAAALRLTLDLAQGSFRVQPGRPGSQVQVDGEYARRYYELVERRDEGDEPGQIDLFIGLRPTSSSVVRLLADLLDEGIGRNANRLTVSIPEGVPIDLRLRLRQGESEVDLGGLNLSDLDVELSMGDHELHFDRPVQGHVERARLVGELGNVTIGGLGNLAASELEVETRMGNFIVDLDGQWPDGGRSRMALDHAMGDLRLRIPDTVGVELDPRSETRLGSQRGRFELPTPGDRVQARLRLRLSTLMGDSRLVRY